MSKLYEYKGPWKGTDISMPENSIDASAFQKCDNFVLRAGELRSAPKLSQFKGFGTPNTEVMLGTCTFVDANGVFHSCGFSQFALYQLVQSGVWNKVGDYPLPSPGFPITSAVFTDRMFFVNGTPNFYSWDGQTNGVTTEIAGYGAFFVAELAASLLLISTVEQNTYTSGALQNFPQRIRWTPSGLTNVIDPAINVGAGFNDMLDVPDAISNFFAIGNIGYVFRSNGISTVTPTGTQQNPFTFDHLWASKKGIGNVYPYAAAQYGSTGIIVSSEQIYELTIGGFQAIGKNIANTFAVDATKATSLIIGTILPKFSMDYRYPVYVCMIPQYPDTICYCYAIEDQVWFTRTIKNWIPLAPAEYIFNS